MSRKSNNMQIYLGLITDAEVAVPSPQEKNVTHYPYFTNLSQIVKYLLTFKKC